MSVFGPPEYFMSVYGPPEYFMSFSGPPEYFMSLYGPLKYFLPFMVHQNGTKIHISSYSQSEIWHISHFGPPKYFISLYGPPKYFISLYGPPKYFMSLYGPSKLNTFSAHFGTRKPIPRAWVCNFATHRYRQLSLGFGLGINRKYRYRQLLPKMEWVHRPLFRDTWDNSWGKGGLEGQWPMCSIIVFKKIDPH